MAKGRMLMRSIAQCAQLADLESDRHRMLHAWILPHLDRDGRTSGDPRRIKAATCPMLEDVSVRDCARAMCDLVACGLAVAYKDEHGQPVLMYQNFGRHQKLRYDKEAPSKYGSPPKTELDRLAAGQTPDWLLLEAGVDSNQAELFGSPAKAGLGRDRGGPKTGSIPPRSRLNGMERNGNGIERKGSEVEIRAHARAREAAAPAAATTNGADADGDDGAQCSPEGQKVLVELRKHPVLSLIATERMAEQAVTNMTLAGGGLEDVLRAVRDLARQAGTWNAAGKPWTDDDVIDTFLRYTGWNPKAPGARRHSTMPAPQLGDSEDRKKTSRLSWEGSDEYRDLVDKSEEAGF